MKLRILCLVGLFGCGEATIEGNRAASDLPPEEFDVAARLTSEPPAFPGAMGFGALARGGRGGRVLKVTNLRDSGPGSLRAAVEASGPRIVVFEVGGIIELSDALQVDEPFLTLAGQTAPGNGVVLRGARLRIGASNVIVRGMRLRPGDGSRGEVPSNRDGVSIGDGNRRIERVMIDSNSISWSVDENASVWGTVEDVSFTNNLIAEALDDSIHAKGRHSMGMLIGGKEGEGGRRITAARNLIANNRFRCPLVKETRDFEFINNFCYNQFHNTETGSNVTAHFIRNFYHYGDDSRPRPPIGLSGESASNYYLEGNLDTEYRTRNSQPETASVDGSTSRLSADALFPGSRTPLLDANEVERYVITQAGARWPQRDPVDIRIIDGVRERRYRHIDSQSEVGGYPNTPEGVAEQDDDEDGMPNWFELEAGLDPNRDDSAEDHDRDGFTNIEEYINGLIDGFDVQPPGDETGGNALTVEAEDMELNGFSIVSNDAASGGGWIQSKDESSAALTFAGAAGLYDIELIYFDENDGESTARVSVNDALVESWVWNDALGSRLANSMTRTSRVLPGVELAPGDTLTLAVVPEGEEPARTDALVFTRLPDPEPPTSEDLVGQRIEAEAMALDGYTVAQTAAASGGAWVQTQSTGTATTVFGGSAGGYDLIVTYFDENDGTALMNVSVNGESVARWSWDQDRASRFADARSRTTELILGVELAPGDLITFVGTSDGAEPARFDAVEILPEL